MYRPEGWENPYIHNNLPICEDCTCGAYEVGADAILGGLKKEAIHVRTTRGWESLKECYEDWLHGDKVGYLVFIPEVKE